MFEVGCIVLYGSEGVCKVRDITTREIGGLTREYYVLEPVYQRKTTVFVPTNNKELSSKMRNIITASEIDSILDDVSKNQATWIVDDSARKERYKDALRHGDCRELMRMCLMLQERKTKLLDQHRKLSAADGHFLKTAEKMVFDELASALHLSPEQVLPFIRNHYETASKSTCQKRA